MGQRHQAFLIAKVRPHGASEAKYRCIAAFHHQWCYGSLPLRATRRLLTLVKQPANAEVIREEIRAVDGKQKLSDVPCPFATTILGAAWNVDLSEGNVTFSGVSLENSLLPASMGSWDGDNNDGITVIDVTNPEDPSYCLLNDTDPLTGEQYIAGYYDINTIRSILAGTAAGTDAPEARSDDAPENVAHAAHLEATTQFEKSILQSIADLEGERLLPYTALCEAWPHEYRTNSDQISLAEAIVIPETIPPPGFPSLVDLSFRQTIVQSLESNDAVELDELPVFFEKMNIVEDVLSKLSPPPDSAISLVLKLAERKYRDHSLDLSGYSFSDSQILAVATALPELRSLNLSRNAVVTVNGVRDVLVNVPSLRRLVIMNCSNIPNSELEDLACNEPSIFLNIDAIHHPAFMKLSSRNAEEPPEVRLPAGISIFVNKRHSMDGATLPFLNPRRVVAGLADIVAAKLDKSLSPYEFDSGTSRAVQVAFAAQPRAAGAPWAERAVVMPLPLDMGVVGSETGGWALILHTSFREFDTVWYAFLRTHKGAKAAPSESEVVADNTGGAEDLEDPEAVSEEDSSSASPEPMSSSEQDAYPKRFQLPHGPQAELYDLRSFLNTTEEEGYPAVPTETADTLLAMMEKAGFRVMEPQNVLNTEDTFEF